MSFIKDIIDNPHNVYLKYVDYWNFLLDSYEGGLDYTDASVNQKSFDTVEGIEIKVNGNVLRKKSQRKNLFEHPKERSEDYQRRVDMSYYYNFCSPIIDIYTNHLFKEAVIEDFGKNAGLIEKQKENIDRKGGSVDEVRRELAEVVQIYGHSFVLTDSPKAEGEILSLQDKFDTGSFPYFNIIHPQNVLNWALDRFGKPYWVVIRELSDANENPMAYDLKSKVKCNYRLWTRTEWILFDEKYNQIEQGAHNLGVVPITCVFDRQSKKEESFLGISFIADIAFIARDIYNASSELKQILRDQTFSILAIQGESTDYPAIEVATNKGLLVPKDAQMPQYITPPPGPADTLMRHIDTQVSKIFQLAKLEGGSAHFEGQNAVEQSGVSKAWDFNQTNSALAMKAGNLEDAEMKIWQTWMVWEGKEFDGRIEYPREFNVKSLGENLAEAQEFAKVNMNNEFMKEIRKALVEKKFPRMEEVEVERMAEQSAQTTGGRLSDRLGLFNANSGGNNGGGRNG